jgi:hypothetical protein
MYSIFPEGLMKAENIARLILEESKTTGTDKLKVAAEYAYKLIKETVENVGTIEPFGYKLATWSGSLHKWKNVVSLVLNEDPHYPIFINLYGAVFSVVAPELFSILVEHRVFINYRLSPKENTLVNEMRLKNMFD